jgi:hypothetical protein
MTLEFAGSGLPLDPDGVSQVTDKLGVGTPELWSVITVETRGCGFIADRRPVILFERHIFARETNHQFDAAHPDISNKKAGGYGATGGHQYDRLQAAIALNRTAALDSASWGIGQVMGFNANVVGYSDVETMVSAMSESENNQLMALANFIVSNGLDSALSGHRWADFARGYNGGNFAINHYDTKLRDAFQRFSQGGRPDLQVRAAQLYLAYLSFNPGTIDGFAGRNTFSALNQFQQQQGLPVSNEVDDEIVAALKQAAIPSANNAPA